MKTNKQKTRGQLISRLQHMKSQPNLDYEDIETICNYLLEDKKEIEKLESALDKACKMLETLRISQEKDTLVIGAMSMIEDDEYMSKEDWKEWLMKKEE